MTNKTISLPEEIYLKLKKEKHKGETFGDVISRLIKERETKREKLESLAGVLSEDEEWDDIIEQIYADRNKSARL